MDDTFLIRCYLWASDVPWSEELTHQLLEDLADFFAERGFATEEDGDVRAVLVAGVTEIPEMEEWVGDLTSDPATRLIMIPRVKD